MITYDDLTNNLGYEKINEGTIHPSSSGTTPTWTYDSNYAFWTMSPYNDSASFVWFVNNGGNLNGNSTDGSNYGIGVVRPVIVLPKSELSS